MYDVGSRVFVTKLRNIQPYAIYHNGRGLRIINTVQATPLSTLDGTRKREMVSAFVLIDNHNYNMWQLRCIASFIQRLPDVAPVVLCGNYDVHIARTRVPGEHKKVAPPLATFVDISAVSANFCMKFYVTVKQSNIHFITKFG